MDRTIWNHLCNHGAGFDEFQPQSKLQQHSVPDVDGAHLENCKWYMVDGKMRRVLQRNTPHYFVVYGNFCVHHLINAFFFVF